MSKGTRVPGKTVLLLARSLGGAERKTKRGARTVEEQLALLDTRPGKSVAERTRLAKLAKESE